MILLTKKEETDESVIFSFGDNELKFYKNPMGPIFNRNGDKNDLCININGFNKILNKLELNENNIKISFKNG